MDTESRDSRNHYHDGLSNSETPRRSDEYTTTGGRGSTLGVAGAAVALAELHAVECDRDAEKDGVCVATSLPFPVYRRIDYSWPKLTFARTSRARHDRHIIQTLMAVGYHERRLNCRQCS